MPEHTRVLATGVSGCRLYVSVVRFRWEQDSVHAMLSKNSLSTTKKINVVYKAVHKICTLQDSPYGCL
jgi:hypothetical protein